MSNYTKATDFASKDALLSGNPSKVIKGTEIDTEFNAIATAVSTKADSTSPTLTGTPLAPTASAATNTTQIATTAFVGTAVTNERTASVTLTNKTLTSPTINTATISSPTISSPSMTSVSITSGTITGITDITVADGGTGRSTLTANNLLVGNGTSAVNFIAPGTSGNVLVSNGTSWSSSAVPSTITRATSQATTSGTEFDFTGIPSTAKRITVIFNEVSLSGSDNLLVQIGDAGGFETTGYTSASSTGAVTTATNGFIVRINSSSMTASGTMTIVNVSGNIWISSHVVARSGTSETPVGGGTKTLSDVLTQIRITRTGTDTFDGGSVNIIYE